MSYFITFEGIEGCGKSTQCSLVAEHLRNQGREVVTSREPGGTEVTGEIRRLLADPDSELDQLAELFLFLADRAQHVASVIGPALARGAIVISDRYSDSTMAYQGYGRRSRDDLGWLRELNDRASSSTVPDLTLWIDCDIEVGLSRARKGAGGPGDRFEAEPLDFHRRIRDGFADLQATEPGRIIRIDGNAPLEAVTQACVDAIAARLPS